MEASNKINIQKKLDRLQDEKNHEAEIIAYTKKHIEKEQEALRVQEILNQEREREVVLLRAKQEKALNRAALEDEARAKSAFEAEELRIRKWEKIKEERKIQ